MASRRSYSVETGLADQSNVVMTASGVSPHPSSRPPSRFCAVGPIVRVSGHIYLALLSIALLALGTAIVAVPYEVANWLTLCAIRDDHRVLGMNEFVGTTGGTMFGLGFITVISLWRWDLQFSVFLLHTLVFTSVGILRFSSIFRESSYPYPMAACVTGGVELCIAVLGGFLGWYNRPPASQSTHTHGDTAYVVQ